MLHVTNGDCAVEILCKAGMQGDILPWRDVLHEGPVDTSLSLEALSRLRARFIADEGWAPPYEDAKRQFEERDARLKRAGVDEEVVLWLEHDLYDQLHLIQILSWFADHPHPRLSLVCEAEYLGEMEPARAAELFGRRKAVTKRQLEEGARAWRAFPGVRGMTFPALRVLDAALARGARARPPRRDALGARVASGSTRAAPRR